MLTGEYVVAKCSYKWTKKKKKTEQVANLSIFLHFQLKWSQASFSHSILWQRTMAWCTSQPLRKPPHSVLEVMAGGSQQNHVNWPEYKHINNSSVPKPDTLLPTAVPRDPVHEYHKQDWGQGTALVESNTYTDTGSNTDWIACRKRPGTPCSCSSPPTPPSNLCPKPSLIPQNSCSVVVSHRQ